MLLGDIPAIAEATFLVVAALFPIVNPLGSAAIFLNLIGTLDPQLNRLLAQKAGSSAILPFSRSLRCAPQWIFLMKRASNVCGQKVKGLPDTWSIC